MRKSAQRLRRRLGSARMPLVFLLAVAVPLSLAASPGAEPLSVLRLAGSLALVLLVSAAPQKAIPTPLAAGVYLALGAGFALFHDRFAANEMAGVLLLFLPLAAALAAAGRALRGAWRLHALLLSGLFAGLLAAAGSRGAWLALAVAAGAMLAVRGRWRPLLLAFAVLAMLAILVPGRWLDPVLLGGSAQGLTIDTVLTGRPEIWRRSLHAVADFPLTGLGIGSYPRVVPALYFPAASGAVLEDAHSLPLQTALDLGLPGLLAWLAFLWLALRRAAVAARRGPAGAPRGVWALGLFGSLVAFTAFNVVDAVALGSPGGVAFGGLLALVFALPRRAGRRRWRPRLLARARRLLALAAVLTLLGLPSLRRALELDRAAVLAARALTGEPALLPAAEEALAAVRPRLCRAGWLEGKVAAARGRPDARDAAWADLLGCRASPWPGSGGEAFVPLVEGETPGSRRLAERAVAAQPKSAAARFWLARVRAGAGERDAARDLYRQGLELAPRAGRAWLELGRLLAPEDPRAALTAFAESCRLGDPSANGCLLAGATAERLGDVEAAIRYYRASRYWRARERAERLEPSE